MRRYGKTNGDIGNFGRDIMLTNSSSKNGIIMFLAGALSVLLILLLTGAAEQNPVGKYEMEIAHRERTYLVYVLDTSTGAVKWVEEMNTPFTELKGD
jgi:hypothetical protein